MPFPAFVSYASVVCGSMVVTLGMILQKKGVHWFELRSAGDPSYRRLRAFWIIGLVLINTLAFFYYFGLRGLPASIVGAMMGLNVVFTAVFSVALLGERPNRAVVLWSLVMVAGIVAANLAAPPGTGTPSPSGFWVGVFFALPYLMAAGAYLGHRFFRLPPAPYAAILAVAAGSLDGFVIVLIKAMQGAKARVLDYFLTPYAYLYIVASLSVITLMQLAYRKGAMSRIAPALYGAQVVWPVISSFLIFSAPVNPAQAAAFAFVALSAVMVQR